MNAEQKRQAVIDAYKPMIGRNLYNRDRRSYYNKKYKDGYYYSDCSSSTGGAYIIAGFGFGLINTAGMYERLEKVDIPISNGQITDTSKLRKGDLLLFRGTDHKRPKYIGHVEMVYSVGASASSSVLCGHPGGKPRTINMYDYCYKQQNKTVTRSDGTKGNRGLVCVVRQIKDDGSEKPIGGTSTVEVKTVKKGQKNEQVRTVQALLNLRNNAGLSTDSDFGSKTEAAVKAFQKKTMGDSEADGIVGSKTWNKLIG